MQFTSFSSPPLSTRGAISADLRLTGSSRATHFPVHFSLRSTPRSSIRSTPLLLELANRSGRSSPTCSMLGASSFDTYTCSSPSDTWSSLSWYANWPTSGFEFSASSGTSRDTSSDTTRTRTGSSADSSTTSSSASSSASSCTTEAHVRHRHHHHRDHREREKQKIKETARERSWPVLHENSLVPPRFPVLELRHVPSPPPGQRVPTRDELDAERAIERALRSDEGECVRLIAEAMKQGLR